MSNKRLTQKEKDLLIWADETWELARELRGRVRRRRRSVPSEVITAAESCERLTREYMCEEWVVCLTGLRLDND
jgi:hypothetical protein